jgi:hypothetical protein
MDSKIGWQQISKSIEMLKTQCSTWNIAFCITKRKLEKKSLSYFSISWKKNRCNIG